jgi:hypothetical protein
MIGFSGQATLRGLLSTSYLLAGHTQLLIDLGSENLIGDSNVGGR